MRVITCSSYGNSLHYGLSMFAEFEKFPYPSVISISDRFCKRLFPNSASTNVQI